MLLIICTKYGKNPSWTIDATGRTRKVNRQTDGQPGRDSRGGGWGGGGGGGGWGGGGGVGGGGGMVGVVGVVGGGGGGWWGVVGVVGGGGGGGGGAHKYLTRMTLNLHENGCKFSQTWLIVILVRHCIFENTYYIFRGNKDVWRYPKVIFEKKNPRWAFYPDGCFAPHYPINVKTVH